MKNMLARRVARATLLSGTAIALSNFVSPLVSPVVAADDVAIAVETIHIDPVSTLATNHPVDVTDPAGPGCSSALFDATGPLDVAIAIDTSLSTIEPTGLDIDGDGLVGSIRNSRYTDPGDSRLAAEVKAVRLLLENTVERDIRYSLITFAGTPDPLGNSRPRRVVSNRDAKIRVGLTDDTTKLETALDKILQSGSRGTTHYYAGMHRANRSLIQFDDRERESRKLVLFISDSPSPLLRKPGSTDLLRDPRLKTAAREANHHRVVFNTFGMSEQADRWHKQPLGLIAGATGGDYHPVEDPLELYCHLASSLTPASGETLASASEESLHSAPDHSSEEPTAGPTAHWMAEAAEPSIEERLALEEPLPEPLQELVEAATENTIENAAEDVAKDSVEDAIQDAVRNLAEASADQSAGEIVESSDAFPAAPVDPQRGDSLDPVPASR